MKQKTIFMCQECGYEYSKWLGKCPACEQFNSFVEQRVEKLDEKENTYSLNKKATPVMLDEIDISFEDRFSTGISELDRVLGGGIVQGSLILVGGDPGIGKSTLLLQICQSIGDEGKVLYVSGEESESQLKMRSSRLGITASNLYIMSEIDIRSILDNVGTLKPNVLIIDSIQTMYKSDLTSAPGSVSQVREITLSLMRMAKQEDVAVFIVGHMTKDGSIAGPRVLEHMVDCVLYFEGEKSQTYRILRAAKNRFGSTNEIGVFEMTDLGLIEITNPSMMLLTGRPINVSGSAVVCAMEGTRPVLAEIQALVSPTLFGAPRRMTTGIDYNRVSMLMAVLEKSVGLNVSGHDAFLNVIGGLKIDEPAADLAIATAIASSFKNSVIPDDLILIGEVGLTGELRAVSHIEKRINEAAKLGFRRAVVPHSNIEKLKDIAGFEVIGIKNIRQVLEFI